MSKSKAISVRLKDRQIEQLDRLAQREGRTRAETAATLLEEAFRLAEFPFVQFRDWGAGREAFLVGTRLRIWWVARLVRELGGDTAYVAENWNLRETEVKGAVAYAEAFPDEMEAAERANDVSLEDLKRKLPNLEVFTVDLTAADAPAS
jgi:hypothetical protein